jgi:antitoxin HicB
MMTLDYPFTMHPLAEDEGGGYLIEFPDLPGCMSDGATPEEAIRNGADAVRCWIDAMREAGRPIPAPSRAPVGLRTINIDEHVYRVLVAEGERQGLNTESIANAALLDAVQRLLKRDQAVLEAVEERTKR